jgi:hypothetical protein
MRMFDDYSEEERRRKRQKQQHVASEPDAGGRPAPHPLQQLRS